VGAVGEDAFLFDRAMAGVLLPALGVDPMHQHPPTTPLLRSTSSAKASYVEASSRPTVYPVMGFGPP
jgi:hypothetical protein